MSKQLYIFLICIVTYNNCFAEQCQDYKCDSIALREFLIACGVDSANVDIPFWLPMGKRLEVFEIDWQIDSIPEQIGRLTTLKAFAIKYNRLKYLPPSIGNLTNLEYLDLSNNQLEELPNEFGRLVKLKYLNLNYNKLRTLPDSIVNIVNLDPWLDIDGYQFLLEGNHICSLPEPVLRWVDTMFAGNWELVQCINCLTGKVTCDVSTKHPSLRQPTRRIAGIPTQIYDLRGKKLLLPQGGAILGNLPRGCYILRYGTVRPYFGRYVVP